MIKDIITYLNAKINTVGYFDTVYCLADKIKKGDKLYPAIYNGANEYQDIVLDDNLGSISYWRKSGDVTISDEDNQTTAIGVQYNMTIPLKLVCFVKKENNDTNDQYFADNLCASLIANLTTNTSALKTAMKAKKVGIIADKYVTDGRAVINEEFDNITYEPNYSHALFSIDFTVSVITNNQCYSDLCDALPIEFGYVTVTDNGVQTQVLCGGAYTCSSASIDITFDNIPLGTATSSPYNIDCATNFDGMFIENCYEPLVDGFYEEAGQENGKPKYENAGYKIYYNSVSQCWSVEDLIGSGFGFIAAQGNVATPNLADWQGQADILQKSIEDYCCTGGVATVENSDLSYTNTVASGGTLVTPDVLFSIDNSVGNYISSYYPSVKDVTVTLDDTQYDIYVNGAFDQTVYLPALQDDTININAV